MNEYNYTDEMLNKTGVYKIVNKVNGKVYYGSTGRSFNKRWKEHADDLRDNIHHCCYLQDDYNICDKGIFEYKIVLLCDSDMCLYYEQLFIDKYWDGGEKCYNKSKKAIAFMAGLKENDEARLAIRKKKKKFGNPSPYVGVSWNKNNNNWRARIRFNGKETHLGCFDTAEAAHEAYQHALSLIIKEQKMFIDPLFTTNTSGYTGIDFSKNENKWRARIVINNKEHSLGYYDTKEEAIQARQRALDLINRGEELPKKIKTSKYIGVCWDKKSQKWRASIGHKRQHQTLGWFDAEEDAALAYKNALAIIKNGEEIPKRNLSNRNTSGFVGVRLNKRNNMWIANATINGETYYIGAYNTKEKAATARENAIKLAKNTQQMPKKIKRTNNSSHKGVSWDKRTKKWKVSICINWKGIHLGYFNTLEEAIATRKTAEEKYLNSNRT